MQVIVVKYHPQTGGNYARYSAVSSSGLRAYVESEPGRTPEENRDAAVRKLCAKLKWTGGLLRAGQLRRGEYVYVWLPEKGFEDVLWV